MIVHYEGHTIDLAEMVRDIFAPARLPAYDEWFVHYHSWLGEDWKLDNYIRYLMTLLTQAGVSLPGASVLDAGCGFGLTALFLNLLGAREVHGIDCHAGMIRTFETYLAGLPWPVHTYPRLGDVAGMPYPDASFDVVISIEAVSHYREPARFLAEATRVLRPGGTIIVADGNNRRHSATRARTHEIWAAFENGPATDDIHGHRVPRPFVEMRRAMIATAHPALPPEQVDWLARRTSGLAREEVLAAAGAYVAAGVDPARPWDGVACPLDPEQGYYIENLLDPLELVAGLRAAGLRSQARAYFGGARGGVVHIANQVLTQPALTPLALRFTPSFRVFAKKPGGRQ